MPIWKRKSGIARNAGFIFRLGVIVFTVIQKSQPDISVMIPTYNRAHVLPRALDSVLNQTLSPKEIMVIDDGSTDGTRTLLSRYTNIKILHQSNSGVSAARNRGIETALGQWLTFLDSDDEWLPDKLEKQWQAVIHDGKKVSHTEEIWIRNGKRVNPMKKHQKYGGWIYEKCLPLCVISPSSVMIHRSVFDDVGVFDESLEVCEDYDLWLRICAKYPVLFIKDPLLIKYGGHHDQLSRRYWGMDRFRVKALEKALTSNTLTDEQRKLTVDMLIQKCKIIIQGMKKRGKKEEATQWIDQMNQYIT